MLTPMSRAARLALALGAASAAAGLLGCDPADAAGAALRALGRPVLRELPPEEARARVENGALLLQARGEGAPARRLPGARIVRPDEPLAPPDRGHSFVVVAEKPDAGFRLGARLARAGARVAVVPGGLPSWESPTEE
jgi:hypothetical protein